MMIILKQNQKNENKNKKIKSVKKSDQILS